MLWMSSFSFFFRFYYDPVIIKMCSHFAYPVHVFYKIRMHVFVCDLARAGKSVTEIRETVEAAYPGQGLSPSQVCHLHKDFEDGKDTTDMRGKNKTKIKCESFGKMPASQF